MNYVIGAIGFLIAITVLIAFHEFGHYWVARKANIKILRFAIGFGKAIYSRKFGPDRSEFVIGGIPLGGYVKMLDEREGLVAPEEAYRAFNRQSLGVRTLVVAAGPMANFLLAFILYIVIFLIGSFERKVIVGEIEPQSIAMKAGIQEGDEIYAIEGREVQGARQTMLAIIDAILDNERIAVDVVSQSGNYRQHILEIDKESFINDESRSSYEKLGIHLMHPKIDALIGDILPGSAAERYGLLKGDRITAFNGLAITDWKHLTEQIRSHPNQLVELTILRNGQEITMDFRPDAEGRSDNLIGKAGIVAHRPASFSERYQVHIRYGPIDAVIKAAQKTWTMTILTFKFIGHMITGTVSLSNISGPVTIAEVAGVSFLLGIVSYLSVLAIISISIGVLNLLPIPMLDGGHLLYYLWEFIVGKPLSTAMQIKAQMIGMALIASLIVLALYNDIQRLFGT